ncbi:MAG: 50S ribosomal protein L23 [Spirochaetales bacterium]|nr:50S ribosomal protein L23 [Spirochaetales bacterium]
MKANNKIIIEPVITEKSNLMREKNKFTFKVDFRANKLEILKAISNLFDVHPIACRIINVKSKPKRVRYKEGFTSKWKKAIITLPENEKIEIFEGV